MKKLFIFLILTGILASCKLGDDDDFHVQEQGFSPKFKFSFNFNNESVTTSDFNDVKYTNENGEQLSITRMRYLISNITFIDNDDNEFPINGYNLVDLETPESLNVSAQAILEIKNYKAVKITLGFNEVDNANNYSDLNVSNWNWPDGLGGGYHIMQYEGKYLDPNDTEEFYALHMGTRKVSDGVFEANHITKTINFDASTLLDGDKTIEIKMNFAEWFKNPNLWDLNVYNAPLMPNYDAQVLMHQNAPSVFSVSIN